jgi:formate dehydrogenase maturation protein FdhE
VIYDFEEAKEEGGRMKQCDLCKESEKLIERFKVTLEMKDEAKGVVYKSFEDRVFEVCWECRGKIKTVFLQKDMNK